MSKTLITADSEYNQIMLQDALLAFDAGNDGAVTMSVEVSKGDFVTVESTPIGSFVQRGTWCNAIVKFEITGDGILAIYQ